MTRQLVTAFTCRLLVDGCENGRAGVAVHHCFRRPGPRIVSFLSKSVKQFDLFCMFYDNSLAFFSVLAHRHCPIKPEMPSERP